MSADWFRPVTFSYLTRPLHLPYHTLNPTPSISPSFTCLVIIKQLLLYILLFTNIQDYYFCLCLKVCMIIFCLTGCLTAAWPLNMQNAVNFDIKLSFYWTTKWSVGKENIRQASSCYYHLPPYILLNAFSTFAKFPARACYENFSRS